MLDFFKIKKIGDELEQELVKNNVKENNLLIITVDKELLKKIDEDIYYRKFPEGKDFVPSKNEITLNFEHLTIKIRAEK
jgi:hypothetical protein